MNLNKAMVDLYKQRSAAVAAREKKPNSGKKLGLSPGPLEKNNETSLGESLDSRKRPKFENAVISMEWCPKATFDQLHGCDEARDQILKIVYRFQRFLNGSAEKSSRPTLISGSRGLGKTSIVEAAANSAKLSLVRVPLQDLVEQSRNEFQVTLQQFVQHCYNCQPAIVLVDDLDEFKEKEELRFITRNFVKRLLKDEYQLLIFCTTASIVDDLSGIHFLRTIQLMRPSKEARFQILVRLRESNKNLKNLDDQCLTTLADNTPSFTALDLHDLFDIAETESDGMPTMEHCDKAVEEVRQSFKKGTHLIGERPTVTWDDIGGLAEVRQDFHRILRQVKQHGVDCKFAGIALYGPPGCGKTMVAQAMANEAGLNFISIKPAELVNKFLGETERNIRRVFSEAKEHEPCMIYFDEFDGLCGTRGNKDNMTSAIQTLLSEMDGFVSRGKSLILASTNRLEDIDPAMKRPGRLSKHIFVGPPDEAARLEIIRVVIRKLSLSIDDDVDLKFWAKTTDHFTPADIDFLFSEAESKAISENWNKNTDLPDQTETKSLAVNRDHLTSALHAVKRTNMELDKRIKFKERVPPVG